MNFLEPEDLYCPLGREMSERLHRIAVDHCDTAGGCHGPDHVERVHRLCLSIGRAMEAKAEVLSAAAMLHDIGRRYETEEKGGICHADKGAELAETLLAELDFPAARRQDIIHCIATHRFRNHKVPLSLEAKILFDADKLDSIGAIGIGRAFLFAGQVGARLHNDGDFAATRPYTIEDTAYREFRVKLSTVKDKMLTPMGRALAQERHEFMEQFFFRLAAEIATY